MKNVKLWTLGEILAPKPDKKLDRAEDRKVKKIGLKRYGLLKVSFRSSNSSYV